MAQNSAADQLITSSGSREIDGESIELHAMTLSRAARQEGKVLGFFERNESV